MLTEIFWVFGGCSDLNDYESANGLWVFQPESLRWIWINGDTIPQQLGFYGIQGIASSSTKPACRLGAVAWLDCESNLWMFGGLNNIPINFLKFKNDLWKYQIDPDCIPGFQVYSCSGQNAFNASSNSLCEKFCTNFLDQSNNNPISWLWQFPGGDPSSSTDQNPTNICYNLPGSYDVTLITTNANGSDTLTLHNYITVNPTPAIPTITQVGYTLTSNPATSYQWQFNLVDIPGATNQSCTVLQSGYYTVIVSDTTGCINSFTLYVLIEGINDVNDNPAISIYPNPSSGNFTVELLNGLMTGGEVSIDVVNTLGQEVFSYTDKIYSSHFKKEIDLKDAARGVYFIEIKTENEYACPDFIGVREKIIVAD